jgi:tetratricopeptide (TPR) repeat protein
MASLIPGYEYDIFISYRQKDNKYDGWVTEFVDNLKRELEATFKEDISLYFDINPHDGLLETHDVDASLKEKLKCLVFIPIISRTYCDPKSFAWEHEFRAFIEETSKDKFGLKVKLPNGNIANRVLPVRIHDLDATDIKLCESVLGGVLRGVEFIYKEPGINRSLTPKDKEKKNLNGTIYRNQINKVALAIKEIIMGLQAEPGAKTGVGKTGRSFEEEYFTEKEKDKNKKSPKRHDKTKIITGVLILAILIIAGLYFLPRALNKNTKAGKKSSDKRICVVVMPFNNTTGDSIWNSYQAIIQQSLISSLSRSNEIRVRLQSNINNSLSFSGYSENGAIPVNVAGEIAKKQEADILIYGSIQESESGLAINTQLVELKSNEVIKSITSEGQSNDKKIFDIIEDNRKQVTDFLIMSKIIKDNTPYGFDYKYSTTTTSPEAVRYFFLGKKAEEKNNPELALEYFLKSNSIDSNYYDPYVEIPVTYMYIRNPDPEQNYKWLVKAYNKRDQWPEYERLLATWEYANTFDSFEESVKYLEEIQKIDDQDIGSSRLLVLCYFPARQYDNCIRESAHLKELASKWDKNYLSWGELYIWPGLSLHKLGQYKKERDLYEQAEKYLPDNPWIITLQAVLAFSEKDTLRANGHIERYKAYKKKNSQSEASTEQGLGDIYCQAGMLEKADGYYHRALSLEPENMELMKAVSDYYIEYKRNLNQVPELMDKAMKLAKNRTDYYNYMDTKGWAYYKMGKNKEALSILQKVWDEVPYKIYTIRSHYEEVKKAVGGQK